MPTPFAVHQAEVNATVFADMADATADFGGGVVVDGIFAEEFVEQLGVEGLRPTFTALASALPAVSHGTAVTINSVAYTVIGIQPDAGAKMLILERP